MAAGERGDGLGPHPLGDLPPAVPLSLSFPTLCRARGATSYSGPHPKRPLSQQPRPSDSWDRSGQAGGVLYDPDTTRVDSGPTCFLQGTLQALNLHGANRSPKESHTSQQGHPKALGPAQAQEGRLGAAAPAGWRAASFTDSQARAASTVLTCWVLDDSDCLHRRGSCKNTCRAPHPRGSPGGESGH